MDFMDKRRNKDDLNPEQASVFLNGRLIPAAEASVPVFDRGFAYGDSLIETLKLSAGRPVFFAEHFQRLLQAAAETGFSLPAGMDELKEQAVRLAAANGVSEGRLRIQLSRGVPAGPGGFDPDPGLKPTLLLTAEPFTGYPESWYSEGVCCRTVPVNRGRYAHLKSASLMPVVLARQEALAAGAGEAILLSGHGRLLEGTFTNLFFLKEATLITAADTAPILAGVTREKVIGLAGLLSLEVTYASLRLEDLTGSPPAAFLTSSLLGVCPVRRIDDLELPTSDARIGRLAATLAELEAAQPDAGFA